MKDLAVAYKIKSAGKKKKFAKGGDVSVQEQKRPMPEDLHKDAKMAHQNDNKKVTKNEHVLDTPTVKQAQKLSVAPKKHPQMAESSVLRTKLYDQEQHLMDMEPDGYGKQPPTVYDKKDQDRQGPVPPAQKKFAQGGEVSIKKEMYDQPEQEAQEEKHASLAAAIMSKRQKFAEGGQVDLHLNEDEQPMEYDDLNREAVEFHENDIDSAKQPMDSNMIGDDIESDVRDLVGKIRAKMKKGM